MKEDSKKPHRMHLVSFPKLKQILDLFTVKAIMTPRDKFTCCQPDQKVTDAIKLLRENEFSAAPLEEVEINRFVTLKKLEQCIGHFVHCNEVATKITADKRIMENTTIERLIEILAERKDQCPLFVAEDDSITGLVTCADLDKIAVKVYFFISISALESLLLDVIGKNYKKYKSRLQNPRAVEKRHAECKGELVGLDEYRYLMTKEILEIVQKSDIKTGINIKDEEDLDRLKKFRNNVAHGNYIIIKDEDVKLLKEMDEKIRGYIKALEGNMDWISKDKRSIVGSKNLSPHF